VRDALQVGLRVPFATATPGLFAVMDFFLRVWHSRGAGGISKNRNHLFLRNCFPLDD
jgi:hypothetical protein